MKDLKYKDFLFIQGASHLIDYSKGPMTFVIQGAECFGNNHNPLIIYLSYWWEKTFVRVGEIFEDKNMNI